MLNKCNAPFASICLMILFVCAPAHATNGLLAYGNGMKSHGIGGAGIAHAGETMSAMDNPALAARVTGWNAGATGFNPNRFADIGQGYVESKSNFFFIPQGSWITALNERTNVGVMANVLGGINTDYPAELFGAQTGVDLASILIAPTIGFRISEAASVGASILLGYQEMDTDGPGEGGLPRTGDSDSATGIGLRAGFTLDVGPTTTIGLSAQTKVEFDEMEVHCANIFSTASDCAVHLPEIYGIGISQRIGDRWSVIADIKKVKWSGVPVISELFGWEDQTVYIVGAEVDLSDKTVFRFGYNYGGTPIRDEIVGQNVLAPAVSEKHLTIGISRTRGRGEISGYFARVLNKEQLQTGTGIPRVKMDQYAVGISYSITLR